MTEGYIPMKERPKITDEFWEGDPRLESYPRYIQINGEVWYELVKRRKNSDHQR